MDKTIEVTIDKLGNPTITTKGFTGNECLAATQHIEKALSSEAGNNREYLPEYYQNSGQKVEQHLRRM